MTTFTFLKSQFLVVPDVVDGIVLAKDIARLIASAPLRPGPAGARWINDDADSLYQFDFDGTPNGGDVITLGTIVATHLGPYLLAPTPVQIIRAGPPSVTDDETKGVATGTVYTDSNDQSIYRNVSPTVGAATWKLDLSAVTGTVASQVTGFLAGVNAVAPPVANSIFVSDGAGDFTTVVLAQLRIGVTGGLKLSRTSVSTIQISPGVTNDSTNVRILPVPTPLASDLSVSGLGGLDTGSEAANTIYYVHLIADAAGLLDPALVFSLNSVAPTYPAGGYDITKVMGHVLNNSISDIVDFKQHGNSNERTIEYNVDITQTPFEVLSGGTASSLTVVDCSDVIPLISEDATFLFHFSNTNTNIRPNGFVAATLTDFENKGDISARLAAPGQAIQYDTLGSLTIQIRMVHYSI